MESGRSRRRVSGRASASAEAAGARCICGCECEEESAVVIGRRYELLLAEEGGCDDDDDAAAAHLAHAVCKLLRGCQCGAASALTECMMDRRVAAAAAAAAFPPRCSRVLHMTMEGKGVCAREVEGSEVSVRRSALSLSRRSTRVAQ